MLIIQYPANKNNSGFSAASYKNLLKKQPVFHEREGRLLSFSEVYANSVQYRGETQIQNSVYAIRRAVLSQKLWQSAVAACAGDF